MSDETRLLLIIQRCNGYRVVVQLFLDVGHLCVCADNFEYYVLDLDTNCHHMGYCTVCCLFPRAGVDNHYSLVVRHS